MQVKSGNLWKILIRMMSKRILLGNKSVQKDKDNAERRISKKKTTTKTTRKDKGESSISDILNKLGKMSNKNCLLKLTIPKSPMTTGFKCHTNHLGFRTEDQQVEMSSLSLKA